MAETQHSKLQVYNTSQVVKPRVTCAYMGREKTGKTHNALSWPNPLMINLESNLATMLKFEGIPFVLPGGPGASFSEQVASWHRDIIPMIQNRQLTEFVRTMEGFEQYTVETIVIDSFTSIGTAFRQQLTRGGLQKMEFAEWAQYLSWFTGDTKTVLDAAAPMLGHEDERESYNVVITVHENHIFDSNSHLIKIVPLIEGQFKDNLLSRFDVVLIADSLTERIGGDGSDKLDRRVRYFCHTVSPDKYRRAGDGLGGGGGKYNQLPPQLVGTFPELAKAWGLDQPTK